MPLCVSAEAPTWDGDRIVLENVGTYTLDSAASASAIYFFEPATLAGMGPLTLTSPATILGGGNVAVPLAGTDGMTITNGWVSSYNVFPQKNTWTTIWTNANLAVVQSIEAVFIGTFIRYDPSITPYRPSTPVAFTRLQDGTVTVQYHMLSSGGPRALKLAFRQNGIYVEAQLVWAKHSTDNSKFGLDWDNMSGLSNYTSEIFNETSISVTGFRGRAHPLEFRSTLPSGPIRFNASEVVVAPSADITIDSAMSGRVERLVFRGTKTSVDDPSATVLFSLPEKNGITMRTSYVIDGINAKMTDRHIGHFPGYYELILTNNAVFTDSATYLEGGYKAFSGGEYKPFATGKKYYDGETFKSTFTNTLLITHGCKCVISAGDWDFDRTKFEVVVDGGLLDTRNSIHYINRITLANKGRVTCGRGVVVGYDTGDFRLATYGEGPCVMDCTLRTYKPTYTDSPYVFDVHADLLLPKGIKQYSATKYNMVKRGPATLSVGNTNFVINGTIIEGATGSMRIEEGRLLLAADGAFSQTNDFTLAGGSLDMGSSTNRLGLLTLNANSSIVAGEGLLTFSDSSSATWADGALLMITGDEEVLQTGHLRFLRDDGAQGLSTAQLRRLRYNGSRHVRMDDDGWIYMCLG